MNRFGKKLEDLPENANEFFATPYRLKIIGLVTTQDLKDRLHELRLAWVKYPDHRMRIEEMANVLKIGVKGLDSAPKQPIITKQDSFKEDVIKQLF